MQDWMEFAIKNGLIVNSSGQCQLCNSEVNNGLPECVGLASSASNKFNHKQAVEEMTLFLCTDSHALQHTEIHGRWSNHFHLTRLCLILKNKIKWNYKMSPVLSLVLDSYKVKRESEIIIAPPIGKRGSINIMTIDNAESNEQYVKLVFEWSHQVFESFRDSHEIAENLAALFCRKIA